MALLTVTTSDSLGEFILLVPGSIGSVSLHNLVAGGQMPQHWDTIRIITNLQLGLSPIHFQSHENLTWQEINSPQQ